MNDLCERILDNFLRNNSIEYNLSTRDILDKLGFEIQEMDIKLKSIYGLMVISDKNQYISGYFSNKVIVINKNLKAKDANELLNYFLGLYILKRNEKENNLEIAIKVYEDSFRNKSAEKIFEIYKEKSV